MIDDGSGWKSWLGLAEPPLECSGCGETNVIFYQFSLVSRDSSGSPGRDSYACGPMCGSAEVVEVAAARLIGPFISEHAGGRGREKGGRGGKRGGRERAEGRRGERREERKGRRLRECPRRPTHLGLCLHDGGGSGGLRRSAVSAESPAMPGVRDGRE